MKNESSKLEGQECACCFKPAIGYEGRFGYWFCEDHDKTRPVDIPALIAAKKKATPPLIPDTRLVEIIRGYIAENSTPQQRPAMDSEYHLLAIGRLVVDEAKARLPLALLERGAVGIPEELKTEPLRADEIAHEQLNQYHYVRGWNAYREALMDALKKGKKA